MIIMDVTKAYFLSVAAIFLDFGLRLIFYGEIRMRSKINMLIQKRNVL